MRKWMAASGLLTIVAVAFPVAGTSAPTDQTGSSTTVGLSDNRRAPLSLVVNGVKKSDYIVVVLRPTDALVRRADLLDAEIPLLGARFVDLNDVRYVSLASLAPHVTYSIDVETLALRLQLEPALLGHQSIDVGAAPHYSHPAGADPSGFLNYSVSSDTVNLGQRANAFVEAGTGSASFGLFTASGSYANGSSRRGLFAYERESEQRLSQLTLGDEFASTGDLGANIVVGGFGAERHFEFQPDYAYFPTPGLRGTVLSPTTADLYVNGNFLRSIQLAPGAFDLTGIPVIPGAGVTQVVLHDAYGNTQTIGGTYYEARQLLQKGLTDYSYHVGFLRPNPFENDDVYGPLAALGEYRLGLTNGITVGGRFERTAGVVSGGPQLDLALPIGYLSLEGDSSSAAGQGGHAYGAAYNYSSRHFGVGLSAQTQSAQYATASLAPTAYRQLSSVRASIGIPISRSGSLNVSNTTTTTSGEPATDQLIAGLSFKPKLRNMFVTLNAERDRGGSILGIGGPAGGQQWNIGAQLTLYTGPTSSVSIGTTNAADGSSSTIELAKSAPSGPGFGYQIQSTAGNEQSAAARLLYQTQYGDVEATSNIGFGTPSTTFTLSGGLVGFRQGLFFTRPISGGYALVDVPGFAGLPVFSNDQYAGRTERRNEMVVPNLSPFYDNPVRIDELRDRLDLKFDKSVDDVRPKDFSGVVSTFTVEHFHAFSGHLIVRRNGKAIVPALGRITITSGGMEYASDLGGEGQFYVENLSAGDFAATVQTTDGGTCAFRIHFPNDARPVTSVGTVVCEAP